MNSWSTALTIIRRTPYQALIAILMLTVTFFVAHLFALLLIGAHITLASFETRPQIIAFFKLDTASDTIATIEQRFKQKPTVKEVVVVTQEEALEMYKETNKAEPLLLELVSADILPASIEISAASIRELPALKKELEKIPEIESISFQEDIVGILEQWTTSLRFLGFGIVGLLGVISFLIMNTTIALKVTHRKRSIAIMRLLGATQGFIARPFMIEGMLYGIIGACAGWLMSYGVLLHITPWLSQFLVDIIVFPIPLEFLIIQCAVGVAMGIVFGVVASFVGVSRQIRN